jgi:hypothetical protein
VKGDLTFLSLFRAGKIPPTRDNAERLRLMRARLVPVVGNGYFNFKPVREGYPVSQCMMEENLAREDHNNRFLSSLVDKLERRK